MAYHGSLDGSPMSFQPSLLTNRTTASSTGTNKAYEDDDATISVASSNKSSRLHVRSPPRTREDRLKQRAALDKARVEHLRFLNDPSYFRRGDKLHMIDKLSEELKQYLNAADITRVLTNLLEFLYDPSTRPEDPVHYFAKLTKEKKIDKRDLNRARKELFRLLKKEYALKDEIAKLRKMLSLLDPVDFDENGFERSPSQVALRLEQIRADQEKRQKEKDDEAARVAEQEMAEAKAAAAAATAAVTLDGSEAKSAIDSEGGDRKSLKSRKSTASRKSKRSKKGSGSAGKRKGLKKKSGKKKGSALSKKKKNK